MTTRQAQGRKISPQDLYQLRRATASAQRAHLRAQIAQQAYQELVLEMENQYGLLTHDLHLDIRTGEIRNGHRSPDPVEGGVTSEPERDAHEGAPRPAR